MSGNHVRSSGLIKRPSFLLTLSVSLLAFMLAGIFDAEGKAVSFTTTYHDDNRVHTVTEPSGQTSTFAYDARGLLSSKTDPAGTITHTYDPGGLLLTTTEGGTVITRTYDARGRLESYTRTVDGAVQYTLGYQWDANGNLKRLTYPDGKQVHYTWNARNLMETVTDWADRQYDAKWRMRYEREKRGEKVGPAPVPPAQYESWLPPFVLPVLIGLGILVSLFRWKRRRAGRI